jgi:hypothetical protein
MEAMGSNQNVKAKRNKRGATGLKKVRHHKGNPPGRIGDGSAKFPARQPQGAKQKRGQP